MGELSYMSNIVIMDCALVVNIVSFLGGIWRKESKSCATILYLVKFVFFVQRIVLVLEVHITTIEAV
jgi:hypothetical protein